MKIALLPSGASCQGLIHEISVPTRTHTHKREMNMFPKLPLECCATLEIAFPQCLELNTLTALELWPFKSRLHIMDFP